MKINITLTWSKIMSLLVLISGSVFSFMTKDANVIMFTFTTVLSILGVKQITEVFNKKNENKPTNGN